MSEPEPAQGRPKKRKLNKTSSTTCSDQGQGPYVQVERVEVPYAAGFDIDVWTNESIARHFGFMDNAAAQAQNNQDDQDKRPAADDESTTWNCFSTHYHDPDGQLQVLHGLHVDFQKRRVHEVWKSGARKTWKMDYERNNETRSLLEMFWNQTQMKVWMRWRILPIESRKKKWKVTTTTTVSELDEVETIARFV